jgi:hypothetical protein
MIVAEERVPAAALPAKSIAPSLRYHALDCVRVAAMFLGVFYHLQFMSTAGFGFMGMPGFGGFGASAPFDPKASVDAWLHSFRMPLFFMISGFFASMMLLKYGLWKYLSRRWWRIGAPLVVAFLGLGFLRTYFPGVTSAFGGMVFPAAATTGAGPTNGNQAFGPFGGFSNTAPFGGFPQNGPGGFGPFGPGVAPGQATNGMAPFAGPAGPFGPSPFAGPSPALPFGGTTPASPFGSPAANMPFTLPAMPSHACADTVFKPLNKFQDWVFAKAPWIGKLLSALGGQKGRLLSSNFNFEHLWFLWYLLIFATLGPLLAIPLGRLNSKHAPLLDNFGRWLLKLNLGVLVLGLIALPAVLHAGAADWTVENPAGFLATFPDCLVQYFSDLPLYFFYFLAGWWLYRVRDELPSVAKYWLWNLVLGIIGFALSRSLFRNHGMQSGAAHYQQIRLAAFALYAVSAACSGMGLLGFFQRFLDRPTRAGKYFSDTILWIYLSQIAIIPHILPWIQSDRATWWEASIVGIILVTLVALAIFELVIRPTPLVHIFGPASLSRAVKRT